VGVFARGCDAACDFICDSVSLIMQRTMLHYQIVTFLPLFCWWFALAVGSKAILHQPLYGSGAGNPGLFGISVN
jgi:hypothetical protein